MGYRLSTFKLIFILVALAAVMAITFNGQALALGGVHVYQRTLAPLFSLAGIRCRFTPTCSRYAEIVIARDGLMAGGWKTVKRIARCSPWTPMGTRDDP